ncbi:hypothetical protein FIBSPDRAFT_866282 [Athelia psychrophila]|uniref:Uncharacterized protein n=1 Tax=Athelia psychrophila TaxID=1759441 RepID=A0A166ES56_9AGAM|nr:hypothetical protein FIBSPDRAFT_866282 [Fibularhizoctonia sp. CBS 109695]
MQRLGLVPLAHHLVPHLCPIATLVQRVVSAHGGFMAVLVDCLPRLERGVRVTRCGVVVGTPANPRIAQPSVSRVALTGDPSPPPQRKNDLF